MSLQNKRWFIREQNPQLCATFSRALGISPLAAQLLINRGIATPEQADFFLNATLKDLHAPHLMKGMDRAVEKIAAALEKKEKICIYGDYDVDGITATAIMVLFLRELNADVSYFLPHRLEEGYGLDIEALKKIKRTGATLLITVDCGISDVEHVAYAQSQKLDVIITDHHEPPETLPPACAIVNPKQPDCPFPFKELAGVGVAFNLIMGLRKKLRERGFWEDAHMPNLRQYLDLVALGTVADIVPLIDENRIFVKIGLEVLSSGERPGIRALKEISAIADGPVTCDMVAYRLAPRINASGRVSTATTGVELLITRDETEALRLARILNEENSKRQQLEKHITAEAKAMIKGKEQVNKPFILASPRWHQGVIGICASRLVEEYYKPTILITVDEKTGEGRGSARSVHSLDLHSALKRCAALLKSFGGHKYAAGLTVAIDNIPAFIEKFEGIIREVMCDDDFIPSLGIDARIPLDTLSDDIIEEIEKLGPFGAGNPEPLFCSHDLRLYSYMVVGNGHLKLKIKEDGRFYDAIGFNMGSRYDLQDKEIRLAFVPQFNLWQGIKSIQLKLKDIQFSFCETSPCRVVA